MSDPEYGLVLRFKVTLDDHTTGAWTKCEGLSVEYESGDQGRRPERLHPPAAGRPVQNIKLTGPSTGHGKVAAWLASVAGAPSARPRRSSSSTRRHQRSRRGSSQASTPRSWSGPTLDTWHEQVALESSSSSNGFAR